MMFIWGRALVHLVSPVYTSLDGLHIYLEIVSTSLLSVGWHGGFSSHIFPFLSITVGYLSILGLFIFTRRVYNTLAFWRNLEESAPLLGVALSIIFVPSFPEEARKLSDNFLSLSISAQSADDFFPADILDSIRSCRRFFYFLTA